MSGGTDRPDRKLSNILVTGGAGFIGCNFIHYLFGLSAFPDKFSDAGFSGIVVNLDALTYAGNLQSLDDVELRYGSGAPAGQHRFHGHRRGADKLPRTLESAARADFPRLRRHVAAPDHGVNQRICARHAETRGTREGVHARDLAACAG